MFNQFSNFPLTPDDSGTHASLLVGTLSNVFSDVHHFEEVVVVKQADGSVGRHASTDGFDDVGQFHGSDRVVGAGLAPLNVDIARVRVDDEFLAPRRISNGFAGRPLGTDDDRNTVFGYTWKRLAHGRP